MPATRHRPSVTPFAALLLALAAAVVAGGCAGPNPSFPLTAQRASAELSAMRSDPKPLPRPVVVVDGYLGFGIGPAAVAGQLRPVARNGDDVITVSLTWCADFEDTRRTIIAAVDKAFPNADPVWTREVDVVGLSMGGLAARYAAADPTASPVHSPEGTGGSREGVAAVHLPADSAQPASAVTPATATPASATAVSTTSVSANPAAADHPAAGAKPVRRLKIARLFTLATPHRGATAAVIPTLLTLQSDMRPGSAFLARLDDLRWADERAGHGYPIVAYGRVPDGVVGAANTAPTGQQAIWVPTGFLDEGHLGIPFDRRIVADVARRLRGEPSYAVEPLVPVP